MFGKSKHNTLAIDLAPDAVRILEMSMRNGAPQLSNLATSTVASGSAETLPERHLAALESLIGTHRIRSRKCVASVPTSLILTRSVTVDPAKPIPPEEQIRMTLQNTLPYDPRDLLFDFWQVSEKAEPGHPRDVLVVATQGSVVQRYLKGFTKLRLSCDHLEVAPCALATLLSRLAISQEGMVGAISLAGSLGYFAVVEKQRVLFCRPFEIQNGKTGIEAALGRIGDEISKCISHMVGTLHLDTMNEIFAFGEGSMDESFANYLANRFSMQVRTPSPFESLPGTALEGMNLEPRQATDYATVLGLALQNTGDSLNG